MADLVGRMAILLHLRPTELLGLNHQGLRSLLIDAMLLAKALGDARPASGAVVASTKELVKKKRARWKPPRGHPIWV